MQWLVLLITFLISPAQAFEIQPFAQSQLQVEERQAVTNYRVVLSGLTRSQATTVPSHELRLNGELWRRVWAIDAQYTLQDVSNYFFSQLDDVQTIYQCRALECGASQFWATEIFKNARLVGRDQFQRYRVALTRSENKSTLYVLYVMERGTRQVMVNLDVFTTTEEIKSGIDVANQVRMQLARSQGWLSGFVTNSGQFDEAASKPLLNALGSLSAGERSRLHLVVQCYDHTPMAKNQQCSDHLAAQLRAASVVNGHELNVVGQAALTASPSNDVKPALRFVFWPAR